LQDDAPNLQFDNCRIGQLPGTNNTIKVLQRFSEENRCNTLIVLLQLQMLAGSGLSTCFRCGRFRVFSSESPPPM